MVRQNPSQWTALIYGNSAGLFSQGVRDSPSGTAGPCCWRAERPVIGRRSFTGRKRAWSGAIGRVSIQKKGREAWEAGMGFGVVTFLVDREDRAKKKNEEKRGASGKRQAARLRVMMDGKSAGGNVSGSPSPFCSAFPLVRSFLPHGVSGVLFRSASRINNVKEVS